MSVNAGKVMLGTGGHVVRGHDGKIVLADRLWPKLITVPSAAAGWRRSYAGAAPNLIASATWESPYIFNTLATSTVWNMRHDEYYDYDDVYDLQDVRKFTIADCEYVNYPTLALPVSRIAKVKITWRLASSYYSGYVTPFTRKIAIGAHNATKPSGSNEPWDGSGWTNVGTYVHEGESAGVEIATGKATATLNGYGVFYLALYTPGESGTSPTTNAQANTLLTITAAEIVYNLAT